MRWLNGLTWEGKKRRLEGWHPWFAWHPVTIRVEDGRKRRAWMERAYRRGTFNQGRTIHGNSKYVWWSWQYAPYPEEPPTDG